MEENLKNSKGAHSWNIRPLTVVELSCLMVLAINNACVNELANFIRYDTRNKLLPSGSTVSKALKRMEALCYVEFVGSENSSRREGSPYRLTDHGEQQLAAEIERLADVVAVGRDRIWQRRGGQPEGAVALLEFELGANGN